MIQLDFQGWFQCRLATDPDPSDEPRGVSGWTYALPGEPDLDRIIRTQQEGVTQRPCCPPIGVVVTRVVVQGQQVNESPLMNAQIHLLSQPVFEGRNGISSEDTEEPVYPFHVRIDCGDAYLEREFRNLDTKDWMFKKAEGIRARPEALAMSGVGDPATYLDDRRRALTTAHAAETDRVMKLALQMRLRHIEDRKMGPVPAFLGLSYVYTLDGPWFVISDPQGRFGGTFEGSPWLFDFWMGCWDADALSGFMIGRAILPFTPAAARSSA